MWRLLFYWDDFENLAAEEHKILLEPWASLSSGLGVVLVPFQAKGPR